MFTYRGLGKKGNLVYIIDFGLAKKYRDARTHTRLHNTCESSVWCVAPHMRARVRPSGTG